MSWRPPRSTRMYTLFPYPTRFRSGKFAITLQRPSVEPFLPFASDRALREKAWRAWILRGDNNDGEDNKAIIAEIVGLRAERARIMGFESHAALDRKRTRLNSSH